ncbi:MAG: hypothetical protein B7Z72_13055, partial [Gemmatimonadetes bacterium 21-71-4]
MVLAGGLALAACASTGTGGGRAAGPPPDPNVITLTELEHANAANAYDAIEGLIAKGLMSISTEGKKRLFSPEPPEK